MAKAKATPVREFKNQDFVSAYSNTRKLFTYLCPSRFPPQARLPAILLVRHRFGGLEDLPAVCLAGLTLTK